MFIQFRNSLQIRKLCVRIWIWACTWWWGKNNNDIINILFVAHILACWFEKKVYRYDHRVCDTATAYIQTWTHTVISNVIANISMLNFVTILNLPIGNVCTSHSYTHIYIIYINWSSLLTDQQTMDAQWNNACSTSSISWLVSSLLDVFVQNYVHFIYCVNNVS